MNILLKLTVGLAMLALGAHPAQAVAPERHILRFDDSFTTSDVCSFETRFRWVGVGYGTVFLDRHGDPVRQIDRIRETLTVTNTATGTSVSGRDQYQLIAREGALIRVGLWFHLASPGRGVVLRDVGRIVITDDGFAFVAGRHQWLDGDVSGLCGALS